ncbi:MAG TPA: hypothetical protein VFY65_01350, partial [Longimicrobium sp.]|nr:hypothetical protein [Longimicrobium sp.]
FLSLGASLSSARTAEEVTVVLRQASAPVGSYRAKRNQYRPVDKNDEGSRWGPWSASVLGYLGMTYGAEEPFTSNHAQHFGPVLPVGVEVSRGVPLGAVSLFVPLIDIGMLASSRLNGGNTDETDASLEQVFAPGAFLVWNLTRTLPLSIGVGGQMAPDLRVRNGEEVDVFRIGFFVGADLTIFHFRL